MTTPLSIVGAKFRPPAELILGILSVGTRLTLRPEPNNRYDPNAKAVILDFKNITISSWDAMSQSLKDNLTDEKFADGEIQLGYIPAAVAAHSKLQAIKSEVLGRFRISPTGIPQIELDSTEGTKS